jgi:4-amino-4-deoxy-L-arabinose transferase-like glycosyltransferase
MSVDGESAARSPRRAATALFALAAALNGLVYLLLLTPWMGEDEPWHLEYASYVAAGYQPWGGTHIPPPTGADDDPRIMMPSSQLQVVRKFKDIEPERVAATQREILASMAEHGFYQRADWAGVEAQRASFEVVIPNFTATGQPPLYYLLTGAWIRLCGAESVEAQMWAARALSWVIYVVTALVGLAFARTVFADERAALCASALIAFLPMSAREAAVVSNDVLAKLLVALVLWISARWIVQRARPWELVLALCLGLLAVLAKYTAVVGVAALALAILVRALRVSRRMGVLALTLPVLLLVAVGAVLWLMPHNPAIPRSLMGFVTRLQNNFEPDHWPKFARTFAGSFGWESRFLPGALNVLLGVVLVVGLASCARRGARTLSRDLLIWCALAMGVQMLLIVLRGVAVGRYVIPMLPVLAVLVVAGLVLARPETSRTRAASVFVLGLIAFNAYFLWGGLVAHETLLLGQ